MNLKTLSKTLPWEWPANANETIARALADLSCPPASRNMAAELAGNMVAMDDSLAGLLVSIVESAGEPEELRGRCAIALGPVLEEMDVSEPDDDYDEPPINTVTFQRIKETLRRVVNDEGAPALVRRRSLEAAVRAPEDWHAAAIRAALARGEEDWKLTAVFCMRYIRGFDSEILAALDSPNADIEREAVQAAGEWGLQGAWPRIHEILKSQGSDRRLFLAAIEATGYMDDDEAEDILHELADSEDDEVAEAAEEALATRDSGPDFADEDE